MSIMEDLDDWNQWNEEKKVLPTSPAGIAHLGLGGHASDEDRGQFVIVTFTINFF